MSYKGVPAVTPSSHGLEDLQRSTLPVLLVPVVEEEHVILRASWMRSASFSSSSVSSFSVLPSYHFFVVVVSFVFVSQLLH